MNSDPRVIERVGKWLTGKPQGPFMLEIRPTNKCNLHCPSCIARGYPIYREGTELSKEQYLQMIDDAAELDVQHVQIVGGGEPMARSEVTTSIIERAKSHSMGGFLLTNGTLFEDDYIKRIAAVEWDTLFFSLDGPDAQTNDYLRSKEGCFERTTTAIRRFNYWKERFDHESPNIVLGPVLSNRNYNKLTNMIRLAKELQLNEILWQPLRVPDNTLGKSLLLTREQKIELGPLIEEARELARELDIQTNLDQIDETMVEHSSSLPQAIEDYAKPFESDPLLNIKCFAPWFYIGVDASGKIGPCPNEAPETYAGDIREVSLKEWWYGQNFDTFRNGLKTGEMPPICQNCCGTIVLEMKKLREQLTAQVAQ